jgi:triosephosphate isomerase (TIM)
MRKPVIAGNWKMYKTVSAAWALVREIAEGVGPKPAADVIVFPPFTALPASVEAARGTGVKVGAQNMHFENEGAFTGEISPLMVKDAGATHVLLGHSERRHVFLEDDEMVARKTRAAVKAGLVPIVCVGETLPERESGRTLEVVERQLEKALRGLGADELGRSIVAYEPVWAIGTGKVATPEQAQEVHAFARKRIAATHGDLVGAATRILYGGSVKPDNIKGLMALPDVDGALVGGASLDAASFLRIVRYPG